MPRISDGVFQKNISQNAFIVALKSILDVKMMPKSFCNMPLEFSPVDECSKFIVSLLESNFKFNVYHISNNTVFTFSDLKNILLDLGINLKVVSLEQFTNSLELYADEYTREYLTKSKMNSFAQERTIANLDSLNLHWENIDSTYIKYILDLINKLK